MQSLRFATTKAAHEPYWIARGNCGL